jgi:DNA-binding NarL/FixJ family response regulator
LIVTTHESPEYLMHAIRAGAAGYVLKDSTKQQLLNAVRKVISGESPLDQELAMQLLQRLTSEENQRHTTSLPESVRKRQEETLAEPLTNREIEILRLLALGKTNRQLAQELRVSISTVKTYIQRVIGKLGVSGRTQAVVRAAELGLLPDQE